MRRSIHTPGLWWRPCRAWARACPDQPARQGGVPYDPALPRMRPPGPNGAPAMLNRRTVLSSAAVAGLPLTVPELSFAQGRKDTVVLGMALEPSPGMDPTGGAASA